MTSLYNFYRLTLLLFREPRFFVRKALNRKYYNKRKIIKINKKQQRKVESIEEISLDDVISELEKPNSGWSIFTNLDPSGQIAKSSSKNPSAGFYMIKENQLKQSVICFSIQGWGWISIDTLPGAFHKDLFRLLSRYDMSKGVVDVIHNRYKVEYKELCEFHTFLTFCYMCERMHNSVIGVCKQALSIFTEDINASIYFYICMMDSYIYIKNYKEANKCGEWLIENRVNTEDYIKISGSLTNCYKYTEAEKYIRAAIPIVEGEGNDIFKKNKLLVLLGELKLCQLQLDEAVQIAKMVKGHQNKSMHVRKIRILIKGYLYNQRYIQALLNLIYLFLITGGKGLVSEDQRHYKILFAKFRLLWLTERLLSLYMLSTRRLQTKSNYFYQKQKFEELLETAKDLYVRRKSEKNGVMYAKAMIYNGRLKEGFKLYDALWKKNPESLDFLGEYIVTCANVNAHSKTKNLYKQYNKMTGHPSANNHPDRKALCIEFGRYSDFIKTYSYMGTTQALKSALGDKFISDLSLIYKSKRRLLILPQMGPGDEIWGASIYNVVKDYCDSKSIELKIATQQRMLPLMKASFPGIQFIENERAIQGPFQSADRKISELMPPNQMLAYTMDKKTWENVNEFDYVTTSLVLMPAMLKYFMRIDENNAYIHASRVIQYKWRDHFYALPSKPKIGISWRSSIKTVNRDVHYTNINEWNEILSLNGVVFINMQYDHSDEEIGNLPDYLKRKIVNLESLDLYNDFEGIAAVMKCLDVMLCPCTVMAEIAKAAGCRTLLMSPTIDMNFRIDPITHRDIHFENVEVVYPGKSGSKRELISKTARRLKEILEMDI